MTLFIYISFNNLLICVLTYGVYIISTSPKLPSSKLSLDFWMQTEKFFGPNAFYRLSYALYRQHRNRIGNPNSAALLMLPIDNAAAN